MVSLGRSTVFARTAGRCAVVALAASLLCAACATVDVSSEPTELDHFERLNRGIYRFNRGVDRKVVRPLARAYDHVMPAPVEHRVRNFFTNLKAPTDIINNWLQGKFKPGFADFGRFLLNSTVGLGGFFDPATKLGLERHPEDFGQTLAVWGVPSGGYFVMPLLGPGTFRDWGAWRVDVRGDLLWQFDDAGARDKLLAWRYVSDRSALLPAERTLEEAFDEYAFVRAAYLQRRRYQIFDAAPPEDEDYLYLDTDE